jgi:hypothetical protein
MYSGFLDSGAWALFAVCVVGQSLLAASFLRLVLWPGEPLPKGEPFVGVAYLFGLAIPLLFAVVGGVAAVGLTQAVGAPPVSLISPASFSAIGAVVVALLAGVGLWRFEGTVRERAGSALRAAASAIQLGGLYGALWDLYRFVGRVLRTTAAILEGEGGVLWTLVAALLVWLLFRGR